jgi:hypothetical protein
LNPPINPISDSQKIPKLDLLKYISDPKKPYSKTPGNLFETPKTLYFSPKKFKAQKP